MIVGNKPGAVQPDVALFGLRWLIVLSVLAAAVFPPGGGEPTLTLSPATLGLSLGVGAYNVIALLMLLMVQSSPILTLAVVAADVLVAMLTVALLGPMAVWVAFLPVVSVGVRAEKKVAAQRQPMHLRRTSDERLRKLYRQLDVLYEIAFKLSTTDARHGQVLDAVIIAAVDGLQSLGPESEVTAGAILRSAQIRGQTIYQIHSQRGMSPYESGITVPGQQGIITEALETAEPVSTLAPREDPELRYFATIGKSNAALCIPMRAGYQSYGVLLLGSSNQEGFKKEHVELLQAIANLALFAIRIYDLTDDLLQEKKRIAQVNKIARGQLASQLHDGPVQSMPLIDRHVKTIERKMSSAPVELQEMIQYDLLRIKDEALFAESEMRYLQFTLRPLVLEQEGVIVALQQFADQMLKIHDQKVVVQADPEIVDCFDTDAQATIFYIVEEAVNNARKHAEASMIAVRLRLKKDEILQHDVLELIVQDDGKGFDVKATEKDYTMRRSMGMLNLKERTELLSGKWDIRSVPGKGTSITVLIPVQKQVVGRPV